MPEDVFVDANALFTKIDLGVASAVDKFGNPLPVSLVDGLIFYEPGNNTAYWQATDEDGLTSVASQAVRVRPLVTNTSEPVGITRILDSPSCSVNRSTSGFTLSSRIVIS